jgi:hypothetical protein
MAKKQTGKPINSSDTPSKVTSGIVEFCKTINHAGQSIYVPVKPWTLAEADWCFDNTKLYVSKHQSHGHSILNGWNIWETPGVWLEAEAHSIIRKKDGKLVDINPHAYGGHRILFLPESFCWEVGLVANRFYPLSDDPKLLELVDAERMVAEFRARFPFGSLLVSAKGLDIAKQHAPHLEFIALSGSDDQEYRALDEKIKNLKAELNLS